MQAGQVHTNKSAHSWNLETETINPFALNKVHKYFLLQTLNTSAPWTNTKWDWVVASEFPASQTFTDYLFRKIPEKTELFVIAKPAFPPELGWNLHKGRSPSISWLPNFTQLLPKYQLQATGERIYWHYQDTEYTQ